MDANFWNEKRVFVTGHSGFKGGWLSLWLQSLGAKVCGYALDAPTDPNLFGIARVHAAWRRGEDMRAVTLAQISEYTSWDAEQ